MVHCYIKTIKLSSINRKNTGKIKSLLFGILSVLFASASVVLLLTTTDKTIDENITVSFVEPTESKKDIVESSIPTEIDTASVKMTDSISPPSISKKTKPLIELQNKYEDQYIIIAGTFSKSNAIGLASHLCKMNCFSCKIIYNGYSLYWVSVFMTSDKLKAKSFLKTHIR